MTEHEELLDKLDLMNWKLDQLLRSARSERRREEAIMAIGQDILDRVTASSTTLDSIKTLLDAWVANNTISAAARDEIMAAFDANAGKAAAIEAALQPAA